MNALAALMDPREVGASVQQGFDRGRQVGSEIRFKKAMAAFSANPDDPDALRTIMELDPDTGARLKQQLDQQRFSAAAIQHYRASQGGALAHSVAPMTQPNAPAPPAAPMQAAPTGGAFGQFMPQAPGGAGFDEAFAPFGPGQAVPQVAQQSMPQPAGMQGGPQESEIDFAPLGRPETQEDAAFLEMLRIDPKRAFEINSQMRDMALDRIQMQKDAYGFAVRRLGGVQGEADYQAAMADIQQRIDPLGVPVSQFLPPRFPGADALRDIRLGAIDADDQLRIFMQEANIEADNERADLNTESLIETRDRRAAEYERANRAREGNQRRGQDMTDRRSRDRPSRRSTGNKPSAPVKVDSPQEAAKLSKGTRYQTPDGEVYVR